VSAISLLDVNLLVALFDPDHIHHDLAHDWFAEARASGWATCPVTENGLVRVVSNPSYGSSATGVADLVKRLQTFCASGQHHFWSDTVSLTDSRVFNRSVVRGHRQLTDVYLLGLACKMGGQLATFDRTIPLASVNGARPDTLQVIASI
jgi:uncharacterized protein